MPATASKLALVGGDPYSVTPLSRPQWPPVSQQTGERLKNVYLSGEWSFNSPAERAFSRSFADLHDARYGIFMANGTATLESALRAVGVGPGDEVIVPALTWPATAMAVHYVGATPVFVDVEPGTLCMDPNRVIEAVTPRTTALIPVHLYGGMADLERLLAVADQHGLSLIEDCAHMHGGRWAGRSVGTWGRIGSFSFQQSKTMASGEGGICVTDDDGLADRLFRAKHIGYGDGATQGAAAEGPPPDLLCRNYRCTAFQAAILADQLEELPTRIARYNENRDIIESHLTDVPGIRIQLRGRLADRQGYYCLAIIFDGPPLADVPIEVLQRAIAAEGLPIGRTYGPVYKHVLYTLPCETYRVASDGCPVAEIVGTRRTLTLPHQWLAADPQTIRSIGEILVKVARAGDELHAFQRSSGVHAQ